MLPVRDILVPVAFTARCRGAVAYAAALAAHFDARLTAVHCLDAAPYAGVESDALPLPDSWRRKQRSAAYLRLKRFLSDALGPVGVRCMLLEGDPAHEIALFARTECPDLIVAPTHAYGRLRRLVLGSVTAGLLRESSIPVLTGARMERQDEAALGSILCATDRTPESEAAAKWAAEFAASYDAKLATVDVKAGVQRAALERKAGMIVAGRLHAYHIAHGAPCPVCGV